MTGACEKVASDLWLGSGFHHVLHFHPFTTDLSGLGGKSVETLKEIPILTQQTNPFLSNILDRKILTLFMA